MCSGCCWCRRARALFSLGLALAGGDGLAPLRAQGVWGRHFAGPYVAVWDGLRAAFEGARQLLSFQRAHLYFPAATGSPTVAAGHNLIQLAFLLVALPALVAAWRRLPAAYAVYVVAALALPLSEPVARPAADVAAAVPGGAVPAHDRRRRLAVGAPPGTAPAARPLRRC